MAQSGWGKGYLTQWDTEKNADNVDYTVVLDYKDEYRGLIEGAGFSWAGVGDVEASLSVSEWKQIIENNPRLVLARAVNPEMWQKTAANVSKALMKSQGSALCVIDEAHFVAPQVGSYPDGIEELATTGRGLSVSSTWISQRPQKLDETPISQADARFIGGFANDRDRDKIQGSIPYPVDVHDPGARSVSGQFDEPVSKSKKNGVVTSSEWIYSEVDGSVKRLDSGTIDMDSPHYGGSDVELDRP